MKHQAAVMVSVLRKIALAHIVNETMLAKSRESTMPKLESLPTNQIHRNPMTRKIHHWIEEAYRLLC